VGSWRLSICSRYDCTTRQKWWNSEKVSCIVISYSKLNGELTFENLYPVALEAALPGNDHKCTAPATTAVYTYIYTYIFTYGWYVVNIYICVYMYIHIDKTLETTINALPLPQLPSISIYIFTYIWYVVNIYVCVYIYIHTYKSLDTTINALPLPLLLSISIYIYLHIYDM